MWIQLKHSCALVVLLLVHFVLPQWLSAQDVRAGSAFLKILPGTRQQNMAGSLTAGLDENYSVFANPGAMGFLRELQFSASYNRWIADISYASVFAGKDFHLRAPWGDRLFLAAGWTRQGVDNFDATGGVARSVDAQDNLVNLSVGLPLSRIYRQLSVGATVKYLETDLAGKNDETFAYDLGALVRSGRFPFLGYGSAILSAGASWNHLGGSLKFVDEKTPLPRTFRVGVALNVGKHDGPQFQIAADYRKVDDEDGRFGIGGEVTNLFGRYISVRAGHVFNDNQDTRLVSTWSFGLSLRFDDYMPITPAPRNWAIRMDGGFLNSDTFDKDIYQGSITARPIHPERFGFVLDEEHMSLDELPPPMAYDAYEPVELVWEASRDPELYDNVNYVIAMAKGNRSALEKLVQDENFCASTTDPVYVFPESGQAMDTVFYQPVGPRAQVPRLADGSFLLKNDNHLSYRTKEAGKTGVAFVYFFPKIAKVENKVGPVKFQNVTFVKQDSVFIFDKKHDQFRYRLQDDLAQGVYFWTVIAYDKNHHIRRIKTDGSHIAQFRVFGQPDLTLELTKVVVDSLLPVRIVPLRNVTFPVDSASFSSLPDTSRLNLENWLKTLSEGLDDAFIEVAGHTDPTGPELTDDPVKYRKEYNQALSVERAETVRDRMREYLTRVGVPADSIRSVGYGESQLLARLPGETRQEWLQRNRRVELRIRKRAKEKKYYADIVVQNIGSSPVSGDFTVTVYDSLVNLNVANQPARLLEQVTLLQPVFSSLYTNGSSLHSLPAISIDTTYYPARSFRVTGFDSLSNPIEIPGFISDPHPIYSLAEVGGIPDTAFYSAKSIQAKIHAFIGTDAVRSSIRNRIVASKRISPAGSYDEAISIPLVSAGGFRPEFLLKGGLETHELVKANGVAADTSYESHNDLTLVLYDPDDPQPQLQADNWVANESILSASAPDSVMQFDKVVETMTPDTTFRFDLLHPVLKARQVETVISGLAPGESDTVRISWPKDRPILAAAVDVEDKISELDAYNNWDIDGLDLYDLKVEKEANVEPLRPEIRFNKVGSFNLDAAARLELQRLSRSFNSEKFEDLCIQIDGHTDTQGWYGISDSTQNFNRNMRLSLQRINSVRDFLVSQCNIDARRIAVRAYGQTRPLVPNAATPAEHLQNRRVEIFLLKKSCPVAVSAARRCSAATCPKDTINAINLGDDFSYVLKVSNHGQFTARDFAVTDVIPEWVAVDNFSPVPDDTVEGGGVRRFTWRFTSLAPGAEARISYAARVNSVPPNLTVLTNVATVAAELDSRSENNSDTDSVFVVGGTPVRPSGDGAPQTRGRQPRSTPGITPQSGPQVTSSSAAVAGAGGQPVDIRPNHGPVARALKIIGEPRVDSKLSAVYRYSDTERDPWKGAIFQWRRNRAIIPGATDSTYTLQLEDYGSNIQVDVVLVAARGQLYGKKQSVRIGPIMRNPARRAEP